MPTSVESFTIMYLQRERNRLFVALLTTLGLFSNHRKKKTRLYVVRS